jgi:hypothetical protein
MDSNYVFLCGVMWCKFGQKDAGKELLRAADSGDHDMKALASAMFAKGVRRLKELEKQMQPSSRGILGGGAMWMRSCTAVEVPDASQPIAIPPLSPIHDAPPGGYTYQFQDTTCAGGSCFFLYLPNFANAYPFYYSPQDVPSGCALWDASSCNGHIIKDSYTLVFADRPKDPCIFGGKYAFTDKCNFETTLNPAFIKFTTQLVGICGSGSSSGCTSPGMPSAPLVQWTWESNFNGTSLGGAAETAGGSPPAPGSGTGGITITSINGVPQLPPSVSCTATPNTLWPPNGKSVSVTVSGIVTSGTSILVPGGVAFAVTDSQGQVQPTGAVTVGADGTYSFAISLVSSRDGNNKGGRQYVIAVNATDDIGNVGSCSTVVSVPHDQGR